MSGLIVIENCIPKTMQEIIKGEVFSLQFPWTFLNNITFSEDTNDTPFYGFNHTFISRQKELQPIFPYLLPIVVSCVDKLELDYKFRDLMAGRLFLQLPNGDTRHNTPHVDDDKPHWVFLYYVNDSDGDTVFFKRKSPWETDLDYGETDFEITERFTPKQGTVVIFDGSTYHASSSPTKNKRCVVNFNYRK